MLSQFSRTELIIGKEKMKKLHNANILVAGIGGVGGYAVEALVRAGVENIIIIDNDIVDITNINRQIIALHSTIGKKKIDVMKNRIMDINPNANVKGYDLFIDSNFSLDKLFDRKIDYIVDAVDNITAKLKLIEIAKENKIPIISAMGTGNKLNPEELEITDISKTQMCPLAKIMRKELKERNINKLKVIYSKEKPILQNEQSKKEYEKETGKECNIIGSISFVPSVAGLMIAGEVIKEIIG